MAPAKKKRPRWRDVRPAGSRDVGVDTEGRAFDIVEVAPGEFEERKLPDPPPATKRLGSKPATKGRKRR